MARSPKQPVDSAPSRNIWAAKYVSRHFEFEAFGETKTGAKAALLLGLKHHRNQYNIPNDNWYDDEDIVLREVTLGVGYRDQERIK